MAMLVDCGLASVVVGQVGFPATSAERLIALPEFVAVDRISDLRQTDTPIEGVRSWARAEVGVGSIGFGQLVVADRRRRWFDHDEVRHLGLLTAQAAHVLTDRRTIDVRPVVVIEDETITIDEPIATSAVPLVG